MSRRSPERDFTLAQRLMAEALGTAYLLMAIVGSGIMAESLAGGNVALALLANAVATGAALVALITTFGPISGAHFNPVVTLVERLAGRLSTGDAAAYAVVQVVAAVGGVLAAHAMFGEPLWQVSTHARTGAAQWWSEAVATFGLVSVVSSVGRFGISRAAGAVAAYITAAYWFTASTSFANPAVTIARAFTDTFTGIAPGDVAAFVAAQLAGALSAWACWAFLTSPIAGPGD